jgi:hypothetical protein
VPKCIASLGLALGGLLVLVYINLAAEPQKVTWTFKDTGANHPQRFKPWVSNDEDNLKPHPAIDIKWISDSTLSHRDFGRRVNVNEVLKMVTEYSPL